MGQDEKAVGKVRTLSSALLRTTVDSTVRLDARPEVSRSTQCTTCLERRARFEARENARAIRPAGWSRSTTRRAHHWQSGRRDQSAHLSRVALVQHRQRSTDPCRSTDTSAAPCMVMGLTGVGTYQRTRRRLLADGWALGRRSRPRDARLCARPMRQICTGESAAQSVLSNRAQVSEHMQFQRVHGVVQVSQSADVVSLLAISFMTALPNGGRCLCP